MLGRGARKRLDVLGKARAAVAGARIDEVPANARVRTNALAHHFHIGAHPLGHVGDLVHEADLGGQHGVGGVLGQLGRWHVHHHVALAVAHERAVETAQGLDGFRLLRTDHDPVRMHAVGHRRTLLQELRVGDHIERHFDAPGSQLRGNCRTHPGRSAHRHRGLVHDDRRLLQVLADGARHLQHMAEIRAAVLVGRRADGDEDDFLIGHPFGRIGSETQAPAGKVGAHQRLQAGLVDRDLALFQTLDLVRVHIDAGDLVADLGQTRTRHQTDIAGPEYRDFH